MSMVFLFLKEVFNSFDRINHYSKIIKKFSSEFGLVSLQNEIGIKGITDREFFSLNIDLSYMIRFFETILNNSGLVNYLIEQYIINCKEVKYEKIFSIHLNYRCRLFHL